MKAIVSGCGVLVLIVVVLPGMALAQPGNGLNSVMVNGVERTYDLYVPASVDGAQAVPLVVVLHPFASSGKAMRALTGFDARADEEGFIVAYPDAADLDWNDGSVAAAGWTGLQPGDDVAFMDALIDHLAASYPIDTARVYLAGFAAGGTMAYRLACESGRFARIAISGALMWDFHEANCPVEQPDPVSLLLLIGSQDGDYPLNGRISEGDNGAFLSAYGLDATLAYWAGRDACDLSAVQTSSDLRATVYADCAGESSVAAFVLEGVGHNWPRMGDAYTLNQFGIDMTAIVTRYFMTDSVGTDLITESVDTSQLYAGAPRSYSLYVPPSYDPAQPMPLVIALHGRPGTAAGLAYLMDSNWVAREHGFMIVYPDGMPVHIADYDGIGREWNYARGFPAYQESAHPEYYQTDDVDFLLRLVDDLAVDLNIDRDRVYVTGFSNGGFMTERVACEAADQFAAYAVASATLHVEFISYCAESAPVPILFMHGTLDSSVAWDGVSVGDRVVLQSAPDTVLYWVYHNDCQPEDTDLTIIPTEDPAPSTIVYRYSFGGCTNGADVLFYVIEGGGHTLPGVADRFSPGIGRAVNMDIHFGETIWEFFSQHVRGETE